jgi:hypothetical protein
MGHAPLVFAPDHKADDPTAGLGQIRSSDDLRSTTALILILLQNDFAHPDSGQWPITS